MPSTVNYGFPSPPLEGVKPDIAQDFLDLGNAIDAQIKSLNDARIAAEADLDSTGDWVSMAGGYVTNFVDYDPSETTYGAGRYKVDRDEVIFSGLIKTNVLRNTQLTFYTMPVGLTPPYLCSMRGYSSGTAVATSGATTPSGGSSHTHTGTTGFNAFRIDAFPNGSLKILANIFALAANGTFSLDGMSYPLT